MSMFEPEVPAEKFCPVTVMVIVAVPVRVGITGKRRGPPISWRPSPFGVKPI